MKKRILILLSILFFANIILAQDEPEAPVIPDEPSSEFEFDFEFPHMLKLSEEDEKELLKNINENLRKALEVIKDANKEKYFEFLRESQFKNMKIPFMAKREKVMREREKKIFEAEIKVEALAVKYEKANESEKRKIKNDLKAELNKLFEEKEERRKAEVEQLENELSELKKSLVVRQKNKNEIIERRMQELLDEDQYLDWD